MCSQDAQVVNHPSSRSLVHFCKIVHPSTALFLEKISTPQWSECAKWLLNTDGMMVTAVVVVVVEVVVEVVFEVVVAVVVAVCGAAGLRGCGSRTVAQSDARGKISRMDTRDRGWTGASRDKDVGASLRFLLFFLLFFAFLCLCFASYYNYTGVSVFLSKSFFASLLLLMSLRPLTYSLLACIGFSWPCWETGSFSSLMMCCSCSCWSSSSSEPGVMWASLPAPAPPAASSSLRRLAATSNPANIGQRHSLHRSPAGSFNPLPLL
jgi:hypothetical protein